jgi:ABC-2 type transport system permease protein
MISSLHIMRYALLSGARDYASIYTWKTWLGGWLVRVLAQVAFFAFIGRLLSTPNQTSFLLVGNAVMLAAMEGIFAMNMVGWERSAGTLPLLAASPTNPVLILSSRGAYLIADGSVSALAALFLLGPVFQLPLPWPGALLVIPLTVLTGASAYFLGTFFGGITLGFRSAKDLIVNVGIVSIMALCGVNVPLSFYPEPLAWVARCLPPTNGLQAIRAALDGDYRTAGLHAIAEAMVGAGWLVLCALTFRRFISRGRRNGSLEFAT